MVLLIKNMFIILQSKRVNRFVSQSNSDGLAPSELVFLSCLFQNYLLIYDSH